MIKSENTRSEHLSEAKRLIEECKKGGGKELSIARLQLTSLPKTLLDLKDLESLEIRDTAIHELPIWIGELTSLTSLQMFGDGVLRLPESLLQLSNLRFLNIAGHNCNASMEVISRLKQLSQLWLQNMTLTTLPDIFRKLNQLESLILYNTRLTEMPTWIGEFKALKSLNLNRNQLHSLPSTMTNMELLEELDLQNNAFTSMPPVLHKLRALRSLVLANNSSLSIPKEILTSSNAQKILAYDRKLKEGGEARALNEAKMILVGRGAVGKTTLVHKLVHGKFVQKHKTKGIKVSDWIIKDGKEEITTHVWDFGGQEIMHGTHQFFLTERALYILVLAGREDREDDDALYWLKMISAFGSGSPVLVVLNKLKEHRFEVDEEALKEKYPNIVGFFETDCKANLGIRKLRQAAEAQIRSMESVKKRFPAAWFRIKDELPTRAKNFITFDAFRKVCVELGEKDKEEQENLAHFLHVLGIALNYREDPRLQETSVLNPHWVTGGIYKIINDDKVMQRRGLLRRTDLPRILSKAEYPEDKHDFLLLLMKKFELCFPLDDDGKEWLIPDLLSKKGPNLGGEFDVKKALCFEYHYEALLPHGLIPRFISRAYTRILDDCRWRTGVVVEWSGAKALVRADNDKRRIEIRAVGSLAGCQQVIEHIRDHFDTIHENFKSLNFKEMVRLPEQPQVFVSVAKLVKSFHQTKTTMEVDHNNDDVEVSVWDLIRHFGGTRPTVWNSTFYVKKGVEE